jgi:hypothetical protein
MLAATLLAGGLAMVLRPERPRTSSRQALGQRNRRTHETQTNVACGNRGARRGGDDEGAVYATEID